MKKISESEFKERLFAEEEGDIGSVETDRWIHGHSEYHVLKIDGKYWGTWVDFHPSNGMQVYGDVYLQEVEPVEITTTEWIPVKK